MPSVSRNVTPGLISDPAPAPTSKSFLEPLAVGETFDPTLGLPTPALTLDLSATLGNIDAMGQWIAAHGAELVPHGKTTMAPAIWHAQLAAGATGITVANTAQARVAIDAAMPFVIIANQVVSPPALTWLAQVLADGAVSIVCWVDSVAAVEIMQSHLVGAGAAKPLGVCVELGWPGSRTGLRSHEEAFAVAEAVQRSSALSLVGVSGYEGTIPDAGPERMGQVDSFLSAMAELFGALSGSFETDRPILTAGGSAFFDRVIDIFGPAIAAVAGARLIVRPGAYVLHDHDHYRDLTPAATREGPSLTPATTLWGRVVSTPEPGLALLDVGKRDVAYDLGLPTPRVRRRAGSPATDVTAHVTACNDQHAYVEHAGALEVGDLLELGQGHPCAIADKWREIPITSRLDDDTLRLDGFVRTYF